MRKKRGDAMKKKAKKLAWYSYFSYLCSRTKYLKNYRTHNSGWAYSGGPIQVNL